jgi:hypothetical protein
MAMRGPFVTRHHPLLLPILFGAWLVAPWLSVHGQEQPKSAALSAERSVASAADDAEEFLGGSLDDPERWPAGFSYSASSDLELGHDSLHGSQMVGIRFTGFDIPAGARIEEAYLGLTADSDQTGPVEVLIRAQADPDAPVFRQDPDGEAGFDLSSRPTTVAAASWSPGDWLKGEQYRGPDIAHLLQELVDRSVSEGLETVVLLLEPAGTGTAFRSAHSFDGRPDLAPRLIVSFSRSSDPPPVLGMEAEAITAGNDGQPAQPREPREQRTLAAPSEPSAETTTRERPAQAPAREPLAKPTEPMEPMEATEPRRRRYPLVANHARGVSGSVLLSDYGAGGTVVTLMLADADSAASYTASLHPGECGSGRRAIVRLEPVSGARAFSTSLVKGGFDELVAGSFHVNVFQRREGFTRVAGCATVGG